MPNVSLPKVTIPNLGVPSAVAQAVRSAVRAVEVAGEKVSEQLPAPSRVAYYGALGVMAVVGALEWPVAAAIGVGVWVASRRTDQADRGNETVTVPPAEAVPGKEAGAAPPAKAGPGKNSARARAASPAKVAPPGRTS